MLEMKKTKRPNSKSEPSWKNLGDDLSRRKTQMVKWRGDDLEFAISPFYSIPKPPWYVIRITDKTAWSEPWYDWLDYMGPPTVWLTRRRAEERAKELRDQYGCKIEVVRIDC